MSRPVRRPAPGDQRHRVTIISPRTHTELTTTGGDPDIRQGARETAETIGIDPSAIAGAIGYAIAQPAGVDVNEIVVNPTAAKF